MPRPLVAAVLLLCVLLFLRTSTQASRSDGHFPLKDIPSGWVTAINGVTTFSGEVKGKSYSGAGVSLNEGVTLNPDGSVAEFSVSGGGESISATVEQSPLLERTSYGDGVVLERKFYEITGLLKSISSSSAGRLDYSYERLKLKTETHTGGIWAGSWVELAQDGRGRIERVVVHRAGGVSRTFTLGYDGDARLNSTTTPGSGATYTRNADGQLASLTRGLVSTTWGYAAGTGLLREVANANGGGNAFDFHYTQDAQRRHRSRSGPGVSWANLRYDANDQLLGADLSMGRALGYQYDVRGNRSAQWGAAHVLNGLDQIETRTLSSRGFGVFGAVDKQAKARVFSSFRPWWEALAVDAETGGFLGWWGVPVDYNGGAALVVETRVQGILPVAGEARPAMAEALTYAVVPPGVESLAYDSAGRLIADAFWIYQWDHAGRLLQMERQANTSALPGASGEKLNFGYDAHGRRTTRAHSWKDAGDHWHVKSTSKVLWAGWLPVLEERTRDGAELPRRWFQWGADLSGTLEGAGGIGGLVAVIEEGGRTLLPVQDGLGNICAVIDSGSGQTVARYQFGPFGEPLGESGEADACPFRWQTKWYDAECQHYYFGYRHYDPRMGRWLSRDPLGEAGGFNLYAYCGNDPVNRHDALGLWPVIGGVDLGINDLASGFASGWTGTVGSCSPDSLGFNFARKVGGITEGAVSGGIDGGKNTAIGVGRFAKGATFDLGVQANYFAGDVLDYWSGSDNQRYQSPFFQSAEASGVQGLSGGEFAAAVGVNVVTAPFQQGQKMGEDLVFGNETGDYSKFSRGTGEFGAAMLFAAATMPGENGGLKLRVQVEEGMNPMAFERKVAALRRNIEQGRAFSNVPHGISDAARRNLTRAYRRDLANRIESFYAKNPAARESALAKLRASDIDHIFDLQLGGLNIRRNLKTLDSFTNQLLGSQISGQLPIRRAIPVTGLEVFR